MAKKKKGKKKRKTNWGDLAAELESAGGGTGSFLREGKTRIRIVAEDSDDDKSWFSDVQTYWQGKPRERKLIRCVILGDEEHKIVPLVVAKSVLKGIFNILDEGYDLLDEEGGYGVTIVRSGEGLNTSYTTMPSRKEVPIPDDVEDMEMTLEEAAEKIDEESKTRSEEQAPKKKKGKKKSKTRKSKRSRRARDEDEDDEDDEDEEEDW